MKNKFSIRKQELYILLDIYDIPYSKTMNKETLIQLLKNDNRSILNIYMFCKKINKIFCSI